MIENIRTESDWLKAFPEANAVFADSRVAEHVIALATIDLTKLHQAHPGLLPNLPIQLHMVCPIEPHQGYIGDSTQAFHSEYCGPNWIAFRLNEANQYELLTDLRFFYLADKQPIADESDALRTELEEHYKNVRESHINAKERFTKFGGLWRPKRFKPLEKAYPENDAEALLEQLGGGAQWANWSSNSNPIPNLMIDESDSDHVTVLTKAGKRFQFVCSVPAYHYIAHGADSIVMFFDFVDRIVLFTFDYT